MSERDRKIVERYDAHAAAYRELWAPMLRLACVQLLGRIRRKGIRRVVDVGTGVGALWPDLRAAFPDAWLLGLDRSAGMLKLAPSALACVVADARALPLAAATVDLALFAFMLFHLDDPLLGIHEARRVVRPGGIIATVTWGRTLASPATRIWTECLDECGAAPLDPVVRARDELVNTPEKMEVLLRQGGFDTVHAWTSDLATVIGVDDLIELRTRVGSEKARFDSFDDVTRATCLASARRRLQALAPADFTATAGTIYAVAS